ncbi:hypothetical protein D3C80_565910 [compost metagenome]
MSSSSWRSTWVSTAAIGKARARLGKINACQLLEPDGGSRCQPNENSSNSTMPITNDGADDSTSSLPDTSERTQRGRLAVSTAQVTARMIDSAAAASDNCTVAPSWLPITCSTGMRRR